MPLLKLSFAICRQSLVCTLIWAGACPGGTAMFREANLASTLLPMEANHDVNTKTQIEVRRRIASRATRERAKERLRIKFKSTYPKRTELAKSVLHVDAAVRLSDTWDAQLASLEARATRRAYEATIFVVVDP